MAIIQQEFEKLVTGHGTKNCGMNVLLEKSREISRTWNNHIVKNEEQVNFSIDRDLRFHYMTEQGQERKRILRSLLFHSFASGLQDITLRFPYGYYFGTDNMESGKVYFYMSMREQTLLPRTAV